MKDPKEWENSWPEHLRAVVFEDEGRDDVMSDIAAREMMLAAESAASTAKGAKVLSAVGSLDYECQRKPWGEILNFDEAFSDRFSKAKILDIEFSDGQPTLLAEMAKEAGDVFQIPANTVYLHGLSTFSSALVVNFRVQNYQGHTPVCLYTVCAQPPGTLKSPSHELYMEPIDFALEKRARRLAAFHEISRAKLAEAEEKKKKTKNETEMRQVFEDIQRINADLSARPPIGNAWKNITPEAAEQVAQSQYGVINIVSDESEALDVAIGGMYQADKNAKTNNGVFLAAFDGSRMAVGRVSRKGMEGKIRGAFGVLAQDGSVKSIIQKGAEGRGVTERCLILREKSKQGWRNFSRKPVNPVLVARYTKLCERVLDGEYPITITVNDEIIDLIYELRNQLEQYQRPGNKYSGDQVKGAASKLDKQIIKMASVLHISHYWQEGNRPTLELDIQFVHKAMHICVDLLNSYATLVEAFSDESSARHARDVFRALQNCSKSGKLHTTFDAVRQSIKNLTWYKPLENKTEFLKNMLIRFEEVNVCSLQQKGNNKKDWPVLINPACGVHGCRGG